jgi:orotate phosphoribosyltransferase-like protein
MITLEIGQLYGMNSIKEVLDAVKELQDSGMADANIQEVLDRSKDSTCKGWGGEA